MNCFRCRAETAQGTSAYCAGCQEVNRKELSAALTGRFSGLEHLSPGGKRPCQCPLCHEVFSGESTFALHRIAGARVGSPGVYVLGECRDPASKGMRLGKTGIWSLPLGPEVPIPVVSAGVRTAEQPGAGVVAWGEAA